MVPHMFLMAEQQLMTMTNDFWFGFEQEYFLWDPETNLPVGFPKDQTPQGQFYCSAGAKNAFGREMVEEHLDQCLEAGINVEGINFGEVAAGQWEYQCFFKRSEGSRRSNRGFL